MKSLKPASKKQTPHKGPKDTSNSSDSKDQICDICAQDIPGPEREKIFATGKCDHFVCYVCSARLRVICDQSDCPICREKLETVIFSSNKSKSYERYNLKECLYNEKYKIYFETKSIKEAFDKLLRYECLVCLRTSKACARVEHKAVKVDASNASPTPDSNKPKQQKHACETNPDVDTQGLEKHKNSREDKKKIDSGSAIEALLQDAQGLPGPRGIINKNVFSDVFGLSNHLNYVHKLKLCDLCLTHNKLFPFEYSYYDSTALKKHMREGEPKTSHRGHPNCTLCHNTFFNTDELIQHMSREHYHCHLCGRHDSNMLYFLDYNSLRDHFKSKHFLCERDRCRYEQFTSAFDNSIDYQLHIVHVHGNQNANLSRGEARQQRTITLESASHRARQSSPDRFSRHNLPPNAAIVSTGNVATANNPRQERPESLQNQLRQQRLPTRAEFPALGQLSVSNFSHTDSASATQANISTEQFPTLAQNTRSDQASSSISQRLVAGPSRGSFVRSVGGALNQAPERFDELEFPPLPEQPKPKVAKKKAQTSSPRPRDSEMTLDQLFSSSLALSSRSGRPNGKLGSKKTPAKSGKSAKPKPIKIQIN